MIKLSAQQLKALRASGDATKRPLYDSFHKRTADWLVRKGLAERRYYGWNYCLIITDAGRDLLKARVAWKLLK